MPVVFFLIDAMRDDYVTEADTPFLHRLSREGEYVRKIYPSLGFCERVEILTEADAQLAHLPWGDRRYGDLLWWANPGVLISPDFFHVGERILGMHSYDPAFRGSQGTLIHWGEGVGKKEIPSCSLHEVYRILKKSVFWKIPA